MKRTLVLVSALVALVVRATNYVDRVNGDNSTANDPMPDAFGDVRNPKRLAYGPVNPPPGGFAIIVR